MKGKKKTKSYDTKFYDAEFQEGCKVGFYAAINNGEFPDKFRSDGFEDGFRKGWKDGRGE